MFDLTSNKAKRTKARFELISNVMNTISDVFCISGKSQAYKMILQMIYIISPTIIEK